MPCQTWQIEILCYIMSVVFEKTPSVFLRSADVVLRCSSSLFAIKHPQLFHFSRQRVISSFPAPYKTACDSVIFKISCLNAAAVLAFKSICNNPFISHSLAYTNASAVKVNHCHIENEGVFSMSKSFENHHSEKRVILLHHREQYKIVTLVRTADSSSH